MMSTLLRLIIGAFSCLVLASSSSYAAEATPASFGYVTIDKTVRHGGYGILRLTYKNNTKYTFQKSVGIRCRAFKRGAMVGSDTWHLWASDLGSIVPGFTYPEEVSVWHESNYSVDYYECDVIEGE